MSTMPSRSTSLSVWEEANVPGKRVISHAANRSVRPYSTNQEYLYAMREDLADWLKGLYAVDINAENFFEVLDTGTLLCQHANNITTCADYMRQNNIQVQWKYVTKFPTKILSFNQGKYVRASSFFARDNIATFIHWCRNELSISDSVMFETNDLVLRNSEKNVILCLLEVARRGSRFGVPAPVLVQMEEEIDEEIEIEKVAKERNEKPRKAVKQRVNCDFKSLDEMVQYILGMCTCPSQFPMIKVSDGKYKVGDSENLIFMRILRQHVMVRVGGGWDTLEHYLNKHDPCRCIKHKTERSTTPRTSRTQSTSSSQSQHQRALTSTGTLVKASPTNKRFLAAGRMAKSITNLTELSANAKTDKSPDRKRFSSQTRNSTSSENSNPERRTQTTRRSEVVERPSSRNSTTKKNNRLSLQPEAFIRPQTARNSEVVERPSSRNSTTKKNNRLSLQPDVFDRLSRPKSTPPINKTPSAFQDDVLVVQRSKKGGHQVHRTSTPARPLTPQNPPFKLDRARSVDRSTFKSKSLVSMPQTSFDGTSRTPRQSRRSLQVHQKKVQPVTPRSRSVTKPRLSKVEDEVDDRERVILQAFEKECISNQYSLERDQMKRRRQLSVENSRERVPSYPSSEDSEVAQHMQNNNDQDHKTYRPPPSAYNSLPRPRKDKGQHDRRTRIPTPVSFNKPLQASRSVDFDDIGKKETKSNGIDSSGSGEPPFSKSLNESPFVNGFDEPSPTSPPFDLRNPRTSIPLDKINRLLNMNKFNASMNSSWNSEMASIDRGAESFDSTLLHSSGYSPNENGPLSPFASIETLHHQTQAMGNGHGAPYSSNQGNPQYSVSGNMKAVDNDFGKTITIRSGRGPSSIPPHILQTCGLPSDHGIERGTRVSQNGHHTSPDASMASREARWV